MPSKTKSSKVSKSTKVSKSEKTTKSIKKVVKKPKTTKTVKSTDNKTYINPNGKYILVIVESPGKIKKLESILGKDYVVMSSYGHIMDLYRNKLSVDIENNFKPDYTVIEGNEKFQSKAKVVKDLIDAAKKAKKVVIAADEDREGEMIGWSYMTALKLKNPERITFHSITKDDVLKAINSPGRLNMQMVNSQKTRRIMDRLV
jgi:DNA topoisomerase-1